VRALADALWSRLPAQVRRGWLTLGVVLGDGGYLRAWPPLAVGAPAGALLLGLLLGAVHPGAVYTYSFVVVALMVLVAGFGAALGFWTWVGFVLADLVVSDRSTLPAFASYYPAGQALTDAYLPLLMSYLLLASLLVLGPVLAAGFAARTARVLRGAPALRKAAGYAVYVVVLGVFTYAWGQATPFMIRPLWSFAGSVPDTAAVQPIQANTGWLALVAALAGIGRAVLSTLAARRPVSRPAPVAAPAGTRAGIVGDVVMLAFVPVQALFLTLLLGGLVSSVALGVLVWLLLTAVLGARLVAVPLIPGYPDVIRKVPLLVRIGVVALFSYLLTTVIVQPYVDRGESSFTPLVVVIFLSLAFAALLLPGTRPAFLRPRPGPPAPAGWPAPGHYPPSPYPPSPYPPGPYPPGPGLQGPPPGGIGPVRRLAVLALAVAAAVFTDATPAAADNCSGLSDCSFGVKVALVVAAIALIAIAIIVLPELLPAAAEIGAEEGFGEAAMEEAFEYANTESKLAHVFGKAEHGLQGLVDAAGGESNAMRQIVGSLSDGAGLPEAGPFEVTRIIDGAEVTIRGAVVDGVPKIGTAFIAP
jgi:hypothetical protein